MRELHERAPAAAWMHEDDPRDCISDAKKRDMIEHAGVPGARLAAKYSIPLDRRDATPVTAAAAPADERPASFEAWCDRFPEISAVERLRDAWQAARAAAPEDQKAHRLLHRAHEALARAALTQIPGGERLWDEIGEYLTACSAASPAAEADERAALAKLRAEMFDWLASCTKEHIDGKTEFINRVTEGFAAIYARAAASPSAEPVAWAVYNGWSRICFYMTEEDARDHAQKAQKNHDLSGSLAAFRVVPLYAAPQPAQADALAEAREPAKVDTKARMDWADGILRKLPPLDPTYSIISILDDHDREDRDEVLHSIRVFADMRATQALFTLYRAPADSGEARLTDEPSLKNPLTPYGMLVRALRIVSGTTLMDMAKALLTTPAKLSAMEFGRAPVTPEFAFDVAAYFDALGVPCTEYALRAAARAQGGDHDQ
ncbi:hypothetical protein QZL91_15975 [Burkholderia multivorans]|nr:hypothetical protein [Burkholderia multivorans]